MAILTRAFKITTNLSVDLFTADTELIVIGTSRSTNSTGTLSIGLFDSENTRYNYPITTLGLTTKFNIPVLQGTTFSYYSSFASVGSPHYITVTYYYDDSSDYTINPVGVWNSTTTYQKNNVVYRSTNNTSYIANASNTNTPPESNSGYWQIVSAQGTALNIALSSEIVSNTTGFLNSSTTSLGIGSTLTDKTLAGTITFAANVFYDSTGTYAYSLPTGGGILVTASAPQLLQNKALNNCTIENATLTGTVNYGSGSTIQFGGTNSYLKETISTLGNLSSSGTNVLPSIGFLKVSTNLTANETFVVEMPAIDYYSNRGLSMLIFITMLASGQNITWSNTKIASAITPSTTANTTDIYTAINDGTSWFLTQVEKGFV
jgi:hypothetical protein